MSLFGGVADWLTGGRDQQAEQALQDALAAYTSIQAPTQQQLSLPQLQEYVQAGLMTPAEAQAYLQNSNAFVTENIDQTGTGAMQQALGQLSSIADAGPEGTPEQQAQMANTIEQMNQAVSGQRGAIEQSMEAKGTPTALIQAAMEEQNQGQDAQQAYLNAVNSQAAAYQAAVQALSEKANVGSALQGQQNTQANTVAQAQNAMEQFNAANQQNVGEANATRAQEANKYNTETAQNLSNQNVGMKNARTAYNTKQAQTAFDDAMKRAAGIAGVGEKQAANYQDMGKQAAGAGSGLIGMITGQFGMQNPFQGMTGQTGQTAQSGAIPAGTAANASQFAGLVAHGGIIGDHEGCYHEGGICMEEGGMVPGEAQVPGDSLKNDHVHAMLSPGEAVIPRTAVKAHMPEVLGLISHGDNAPHLPPPGATPAHPHDVASVLQALREIRMGRA